MERGREGERERGGREEKKTREGDKDERHSTQNTVLTNRSSLCVMCGGDMRAGM